MGRFLNSRAAATAPLSYRPAPAAVPVAEVYDGVAAAAPPGIVQPVRSSLMVSVGLVALCAYLISGYATDLSYRFLGTKPYISMISGVLLFLMFLLSGHALEGLRTTSGKLWLFLMLWMLGATVFSRWKGGSLDVMGSYIYKQHLFVFYIPALALTIGNCRTVLKAIVFGGFVLLLTCIAFGAQDEAGRLILSGNPYLSNPNDLAMELLRAAGFFVFMVRAQSKLARAVGMVGVAGCLYFILKTGSRGAMLSTVVFCVAWILCSDNRIRTMMILVPALLLSLLFIPEQMSHRLTLIVFNPQKTLAGVADEDDSKTLQSQIERERLLKMAVMYSVTNPIFGIGPGQFPDAVWRDGKKQGRHEPSLGTHNTYLQISAECGIPALIAFAGALLASMRSGYKLFRFTLNKPPYRLVNTLALVCFLLTILTSVDIFFHHVAYSSIIALVVGFCVAVELASKRVFDANAAAQGTSTEPGLAF